MCVHVRAPKRERERERDEFMDKPLFWIIKNSGLLKHARAAQAYRVLYWNYSEISTSFEVGVKAVCMQKLPKVINLLSNSTQMPYRIMANCI